MSLLQFFYGNRDYFLQLREIFEVQEESYNNPEGYLRLYFNPWLCHLEEFCSRTKARPIWTTNHVLQGEADSEESETSWTREPYTEILWQSTILARTKLYFTIASLLNDMIVQLHELNDYRTPNIGFFVWMLMHPKTSSTATRICRCVKTMPENARCSPGGNKTNSDTDTSTTSTESVNDKISKSKEMKTSITMSIARLDGGITEPRWNLPASPSSSSSPLQRPSWSSWQPASTEKGRVFGFLVRIPENRRCVDSRRTNTAHTAQYSLFTSAGRIALGSSHTDCSVIFVRLKRVCHLVSTCLTLCCSLTRRALRAHPLPHSLFLPPRHQNTHYNRDNTIHSKNTQCIINLSKQARSQSIAIKIHSGVKTCRVTETLRNTILHRSWAQRALRPRRLRLSQGSRGQQIHIRYKMHRKNLEKKITELRLPKKWRNLEKLGHPSLPDYLSNDS